MGNSTRGRLRAIRSVTVAVAPAVALAVAVGGCTTGSGDEPSSAGRGSADDQTVTATLAPAASGVDWTSVASDVEPSVVSIVVQTPGGGGDQGSGVVIDDRGDVLTNHHVVAAADQGGSISVVLDDASILDASVVGSDPVTDLAVLRVDSPPDSMKPLPFGESDELRVGQPVMALGNPLGLSNTTTVGIVSALDRPVTTQDPESQGSAAPVVTNAIQTDAAVNPGNSGGPLIDARGELIGINSSIASLGGSSTGQGGSIGLGFAIPADEAKWVSEELLDGGQVEHAFLGVTPADAVVEVDGVKRQAAGIGAVVSGTPADRAGLQRGDAVIKVDGEEVASALSLVAQIREREPGTQVTLTVVDGDGGTRDERVEFTARPD